MAEPEFRCRQCDPNACTCNCHALLSSLSWRPELHKVSLLYLGAAWFLTLHPQSPAYNLWFCIVMDCQYVCLPAKFLGRSPNPKCDGINVFIRKDTRESELSPDPLSLSLFPQWSCEDTAWRQTSASQELGSHQKLTQQASWSWTSQPQNCEKQMVVV